MDGEILIDGIEDTSTGKKTYTEVFIETFPFYLNIGMPREVFWDGDPRETLYYRQAYQMKQEEQNRTAWLNGLYVHNALATVISKVINKNSNMSYPKEPLRLYESTDPEEIAIKQEEEEAKALVWMDALTHMF